MSSEKTPQTLLTHAHTCQKPSQHVKPVPQKDQQVQVLLGVPPPAPEKTTIIKSCIDMCTKVLHLYMYIFIPTHTHSHTRVVFVVEGTLFAGGSITAGRR